MNSIQDLNNYNTSTTLPFTDNRGPNVFLTLPGGIDQSITVDQGSSHLLPQGLNISSISQGDATNIYFEIDVSVLEGATVSWASTPGSTVVTNPSTGVYRISNIETVGEWNLVKAPTIALPVDIIGSGTYTATLGWTNNLGNQTRSYGINITIEETEFLSQPVYFYFQQSTSQLLYNTPEIIGADGSWTVTITPSNTVSISTFTSTGSGGSFSVNGTTKVITIIGTKAQVNDHLSKITLVSTAVPQDFVMTYVANNGTAKDTIQQEFRAVFTTLLGATRTMVLLYNEDTERTLSGGPLITAASTTDVFTYRIEAFVTQSISEISHASVGVWIQGINRFEVSGVKADINAIIDDLSIIPGPDYNDDIVLIYTLIAPDGTEVSRVQNLAISATSVEVSSNMSDSRTYLSNNKNLIFSTNTPSITDADPNDERIYDITLSCAFGEFGYVNNGYDHSKNWSFSGTRAEINAAFPEIGFYPDVGYSSSTTFTYTQQKQGSSEITTITATLTGTASAFILPYTGDTGDNCDIFYTPGTTQWYPRYEMIKYAVSPKMRILMVGAGGGGDSRNPTVGLGGEGGDTYETDLIDISDQTYEVTIGQGGLGGTLASPEAADGGATSGFGYTVAGGSGGVNSGQGEDGEGYSNFLYNFANPLYLGGGGGAGSSTTSRNTFGLGGAYAGGTSDAAPLGNPGDGTGDPLGGGGGGAGTGGEGWGGAGANGSILIRYYQGT